MSLSFLIKILCYACWPFTITLASSAFICAGRPDECQRYQYDGEGPTCVMRILMNDGAISLTRQILTYFIQ